jgi:hypothetical protein
MVGTPIVPPPMDAHHGGKPADGSRHDRTANAVRKAMADAPFFAAEGEVRRGNERHSGKDDGERFAAHIACDDAADQYANDHRNEPSSQQLPIDRAALVVRAHRGERCRDDGCERGSHRDMHVDVGIDSEKAEDHMERWNHDDAAADAQHTGNETTDHA